jgi:WD40 repeat protein
MFRKRHLVQASEPFSSRMSGEVSMSDPSSGPVPAKVDSAPGAASTPDNLGPTVPHLDATVDAPSHAQAVVKAPPPVVPGFEVQRVLGRGGMGIVYLARQQGLNRLVALKMILSGAHADTLERQRFRREAEAVARLQHPGIVQVHQVGEHEEMPFLVLEYVPGGPLSSRLAGQPQPPELAAAWVAALADAVGHAHEQGVVHRDLKPANVLVAGHLPAGSPLSPQQLKITDFGLAKAVTGDAEAPEAPTMPGDVLGTPSYMAPEQAEGRTQEVGPLADVYALGAILYELLTGRPPFKADNALNTLRQVVEAEPAAPRVLNPGVPRDLEVICLKCLRKEPGKRYPSAAALSEDLGRYRRGEPIYARPVGALERGWRLVRRNPVVSALTAAVFVSLLAGLGFSLHYAHQAGIDAEEARSQAARAERAAFKEGNALYLTEMNLAARSFRDGEIAVVRQLLDKWLPGPNQIDRRGPEWSLLQRQSVGALRVLGNDIADVHALAWHPSGQLVFSRRGPRFGARDAVTGAGLFETELPPLTAALAVRPDGKQVAAAVWGNRFHLIDASGRQTKSPAFSSTVRAVSYRPDGRELVTGCADFCVRRHDVETGAVLQTLPRAPVGHHAFVIGAAYVSGSSHIVSLDVYRWLIRWDPATGKPVWKLQTETGNIAKVLAVHPHRPLAALGFTVSSRHAPEYGYIELRELDRGTLISSLECAGGILCLAFNPEGNLLAAAGLDGVVRIWDVKREQLLAELAGQDTVVAALAWHPDGWRLASTGDRTLRLCSVRTSALERSWSCRYVWPVLHPRGECLLLLGGVPAGVRVPLDGPHQKIPIPELSGTVYGGDWSADGRWVALAVQNHAEIRDGKTLQVRHRLPDSSFQVTDVRFTPDGEHLLTHNGGGEVCVWELSTGKLLRSWKGAPSRGVLAVAPDGERVAILNQSVALFRLDTGAKLWEKAAGHPAQYMALDFLPDGRLLVGGDEGEIWVFRDPPEAEPERTLRSGSRSLLGVRAVADGRRLLSHDREGVLTIWDVESWEVLRTLPAEIYSGPLVVEPGGRWLVRHVGERWAVWDLRPLDEALARRQEAFALVDHLAGRCVDRADLLRLVRTHPAVADEVRSEALALAERYDEDPAALQWEVFDVACDSGRSAEAYAEQLARADRTIRALPDQPVPLLARAALRLRLDQSGLTEDLRAAEERLPRVASVERVWLVRLQALEVAKKKRAAEARALTAKADSVLPGGDPRGDALKMEALSLIPRQP